LVACFQSLHWFNPKLTLPEFRRILKPAGKLAVVWNNRDGDYDEFSQGYSHLIKRASNNHPVSSRMISVEPLQASQLFSDVRCHTFAYRQALDLEELIGRAMSSSYVPREGLVQQQFFADLKDLHNRFCDANGLVYLVYCTEVYLAQSAT